MIWLYEQDWLMVQNKNSNGIQMIDPIDENNQVDKFDIMKEGEHMDGMGPHGWTLSHEWN